MDVPTEGHYGASEFFDGMDELAIHEISQVPQHESIDFVKAQLARTQQDNELMRQVKLYGVEQLNHEVSAISRIYISVSWVKEGASGPLIIVPLRVSTS